MNGQDIRVRDLGFADELLLRHRRVADKDLVLDLLDDPEILFLKAIPEIACRREIFKRIEHSASRAGN